MTVIPIVDYRPSDTEPPEKPKTLEDWPWDPELGKPYGDINGPVILSKPPEVNDLARYKEDKINAPIHYRHLPVECIEIAEHMTFCLGNVVKYIYRCNLKGGVEDLKKARWYLDREIKKRDKGNQGFDSDAGC